MRATTGLFAAVSVAEFPAQAVLRLRPDLLKDSVVIVDGVAPHEKVCAVNVRAQQNGAEHGMTRMEVEVLHGICILTRSHRTEIAAKKILFECLSGFSPRIEEVPGEDSCGYVLDIGGTERLFGVPENLAQQIRDALIASGFQASIAISANYDTARILSTFTVDVRIVRPGTEAASLSNIPITSLPLSREQSETFSLWGIRTLGELSALDEKELVTRFGDQSRAWLALSRGESKHTFQPVEPNLQLREHIEFDSSIENMESLLFIAAHMIRILVDRSMCRALSLAALHIEMTLAGSRRYARTIRSSIPCNDAKFLLKLMQLEIAAHPPLAAALSLTLTAEAGEPSIVQMGLFAPQSPEPSRLDVTIARLKAMVGVDRVCSPCLIDSHRPGAFRMNEFMVSHAHIFQPSARARTCLRRLRPPRLIEVRTREYRPERFRDGSDNFAIQVAYGPWHTSGSWWSADRWDLDEWDVAATNHTGDPLTCLLLHDQIHGRWLWEAIYD